jgi:flagellar motor component MotA
MESTEPKRDRNGDQWEQRLLNGVRNLVRSELEILRTELKDQGEAIEGLKDFHITHMTEDHPKLLNWIAVIVGGMTGASGVIGFVLGVLYQLAK